MEKMHLYNQVTVNSLENFGFFRYDMESNSQFTVIEYGNDDFYARGMDSIGLFMGQFAYLCDKNIKDIVDKFNKSADKGHSLFEKEDLKSQISKADYLLNLMDTVKYTLVAYKSYLTAATFFEDSQCENKLYLSAPENPITYGKKICDMQLKMEFIEHGCN